MASFSRSLRPDEAFADTGPVGALFFGWMPGEIFCGLVYGFFRLLRYFFVRERPIVATAIDSQTGREDSGNPYQSP